ncbi:uncharacterized protein [Eurosta solidaginis]|uniref:uncharacterized protein isoform X4 n=1 Tax=Eurosta solidaginis TaxID=178769 RepID=UPI003530D694
MNSAIKELLKKRANIFKVLMWYQKAQISICGYVQTEVWQMKDPVPDKRYRFLYINVGSPGGCNDSQIFENSNLKRELESCPHLSSMTTNLGNYDVPIVTLGDSAFRFSKYLMKPYPFSLEKTSPQKAFNYQHARSRRVVEKAKLQFRRIGKGIDNRIDNAKSIIKACCGLHNFLIAENDPLSLSWLTEQNTNEQRRQPHSRNLHQNLAEAELIRNAFSLYCDFSDDLEEVADGNGDGSDDGNGDEDRDNWGEDVVGGES